MPTTIYHDEQEWTVDMERFTKFEVEIVLSRNEDEEVYSRVFTVKELVDLLNQESK